MTTGFVFWGMLRRVQHELTVDGMDDVDMMDETRRRSGVATRRRRPPLQCGRFSFGECPFSVSGGWVAMRNTKITCTIGPSIESAEMLEKMIRGGMNVARLNMSHATHEWTREIFQRIRTASDKVGIPCAIMMDTQGPSIRTGDLPVPMELKPGDIFEFTVKGAQSEEGKSVDVNYPNLVKDIHEG